MKVIKHIQTWLLITLLALSANGAVSAKVASGGINLSNEVHQGLNDSKSLNALVGISDVSTIHALGSSIVPKGTKTPTKEMEADPYHPDWKNHEGPRAVGADVVRENKKVDPASDLITIKRGSKEWNATAKDLSIQGKARSNYRVETATDAKDLLSESRGNMNRYKNYAKDKGKTYSKGYETHNSQNPRELGAGNDLQHLKWKDGKSGGHIFYDKPN